VILARGGEVGLGHLARCTALAQALRLRGVRVLARVVGTETGIDLDGTRWEPAGPAGEQRPALAVLDGYDVGLEHLAGAEPELRFWMHSPPEEAAGDAYLDLGDGPGADGIAAACLRRAYWRGPQRASQPERVGAVLVTVGGSDAGGPIGELAAEVARALPGAAVTMIRGPQSRSAVPPGVEVVDSPADLRPLLDRAELVVSAAGQTMLEALATAAPTIALVRVENQRSQAQIAYDAGAALPAGEHSLGSLLGSVDADPDRRRELARRAAAAVDGLGAHRVADRLLRLHAGSAAFSCFGVTLRPARAADAAYLLELRNDPSAYPLYGTPRPVEPDEHQRWLEASLASESRELLVIERSGEACGQLRLDRIDAPGGGPSRPPWELSISLGGSGRGRGVGRRAIAAGALLAWVRLRAGEIRAEVHPKNQASLTAFGACGFRAGAPGPAGFEQLSLQRSGYDWDVSFT
jgi:RimJ/RimL family protein N-acetyltransferase